MDGFDNNHAATRVHDDLYVRCLALGVNHQTLALCEVDVIGLSYDDVLKVCEKLKAQAPEVPQVIVASSHDHEGFALPMRSTSSKAETAVHGWESRYHDRWESTAPPRQAPLCHGPRSPD
jgi:hypothetical protein